MKAKDKPTSPDAALSHAILERMHRHVIKHMPTLEQASLPCVTVTLAVGACDTEFSIMIQGCWKT